MPDPLLIGKSQSDHPVVLLPNMANRHGLIAGATGTGKTVTLQVLAEGLSRIGVPIFMADVKGDLSGMSQAGSPTPRVADRLKQLSLTDYAFSGCPVTFWDVLGEGGHPIRTTVSEMGPLLLSRMLNLNDTQEASCRSSSKSRMTMDCCSSISRICARCCSMPATIPRTFRRSTGTSPRPASAPSSAAC